MSEMFTKYTSDMGLIGRIYTELKKLNSQRISNPINKCANEKNRQFKKEDVEMANKHMKKCSTSLAIKEMQFKTILRFHLTPVRMAIIENTSNNKCWGGFREQGTLIHCWWECKLVQKTVWRLPKD
jgi:hypothetical protein